MDITKKYTLSREVEANEEILSTHISHRLSIVVCITFVLAFTSVPIVQILLKGMPKEWTDDGLRTSCYMENTLTSHFERDFRPS